MNMSTPLPVRTTMTHTSVVLKRTSISCSINGPTGMIAGGGTGVLRTMLAKRECIADIIPVDMAINVMIVAAWHMATEKPNEMPIYNVTSGDTNPIT